MGAVRFGRLHLLRGRQEGVSYGIVVVISITFIVLYVHSQQWRFGREWFGC